MPRQVDVMRVFIASPGGLEDERAFVRSETAKFNESLMLDFDVAFFCEGWERVAGGAGRPQAIINETVRECDYMILILWDKWGSKPAEDDKHTSGTEEEFAIAHASLSDKSAPMMDILLLFKGVSERQIGDPGEQLQKVLGFKRDIEEAREFFYKTFDTEEEFRYQVGQHLLGWARGGGKGASAGPPATSPPELPSGATTLETARALESSGLMTQAEAAYAIAIADGDIESLESYARFLRRAGRASRSIEINSRILSAVNAGSGRQPTEIQRAGVLANMGIVHRKQGRLLDSIYALNESIQTAEASGVEGRSILAYALDNLGITYQRIGDLSMADVALSRSLEVRSSVGDDLGRAETLSNLARLRRRKGELETALTMCKEAVSLLSSGADRRALAGAVAALGEIYEAMGDLDSAEAHYRQALELNEQLGIPDAIAMSFGQLGRLLLERGHYDEAERCAQRSLDENDRVGNREGSVGSTHLLARVLGRKGRSEEAIGLFEEAIEGYSAMKNPTGEAWARLHLAQLLLASGQDVEAAAQARAASQIAESHQHPRLITEAQALIDQTS